MAKRNGEGGAGGRKWSRSVQPNAPTVQMTVCTAKGATTREKLLIDNCTVVPPAALGLLAFDGKDADFARLQGWRPVA